MTESDFEKKKPADLGNARLVFCAFHIFASSETKQRPQLFQLNKSGIFFRKIKGAPSDSSTVRLSGNLNIVCEIVSQIATVTNQSITNDFFSNLGKLREKRKFHLQELRTNQSEPSRLTKAIGQAGDEITELVEQRRVLDVRRDEDHTHNSLLSYLDAVIEEIAFLLGLGPNQIKAQLLSLRKSKSLSDKEFAKFISWLVKRTRLDDLSIVSQSFTELFDGMMKQSDTSVIQEVSNALKESEQRAKQIDKTYAKKKEALDVKIREQKVVLQEKKKKLGSVEKSNNNHVEMQEKLTFEIHSNLTEALKTHGIFCESNPIEAIREILSFSWTTKELQRLDEDRIVSCIADNPMSFSIFRHLIHLSLNKSPDSHCHKCQLSNCSCPHQERFRAFVENVLSSDYEVFLRSIKNYDSIFPLIGLKLIYAIKWMVIHHEKEKFFGRILSGMVVPSLNSQDFFLNSFIEPTSDQKDKAIDSIWKSTALKIGIKEPDRKWLIEGLFNASKLEYSELKSAVEAQLQYYTILHEDEQAIRDMVESAASNQKDQVKS